MSAAVYYHPTDSGMQTLAGDRPITYVGVSYRIPASAFNTIQQLEWERPPNELVRNVTLDDGRSFEPDRHGIIERFDTIDGDTGDVIVTYRIPCRTRRESAD